MKIHQCIELMKRARLGKRKLGNNFYLTQDSFTNDFHFVHHQTSIVKLSLDGTLTLNNDGWFSVTTKKNLNKILQPYGYSIFQKNHIWYLFHSETRTTFDFYNGMRLRVENLQIGENTELCA